MNILAKFLAMIARPVLALVIGIFRMAVFIMILIFAGWFFWRNVGDLVLKQIGQPVQSSPSVQQHDVTKTMDEGQTKPKATRKQKEQTQGADTLPAPPKPVPHWAPVPAPPPPE